jgi:hypothetical protein
MPKPAQQQLRICTFVTLTRLTYRCYLWRLSQVCTKASRIITMMMAAPDAMQGLGNDFGANISAQMHKACNRKGEPHYHSDSLFVKPKPYL